MNNIKPIYTTEEVANHLLRNQYWSDYFTNYHPDVLISHRLSFNTTQLNSNARDVVLWALGEWSKVVDITFEETTSDDSFIKFISSDYGYICNPRYNNYIHFMEINLDQQDVLKYGSDKGTILSHNALHEIGHALGLVHAGSYNGGYPVYGKDNDYENDSFLSTVMSYFSQDENITTDASFGYCATPMVADIVAVQKIYGAPQESLKNDIYKIDVKQGYYPFIQTIYDSGGNDLLDLRLVEGVENYININVESWSSIGGYKKNMTIAQNTTIESVIGSNGNDVIIGNSSDNSMFQSNGNDFFDGSKGLDSVFYYSPSDVYKIYRFDNKIIVYDEHNDKKDFLLDVEVLHFTDREIDSIGIQNRSILDYIASHEDLLQYIGSDLDASLKHFYDFGLSEGRNITFDPYLYIGSYDDLREAFGSDRDSASRHYIEYGFKEGRIPYAFKSLEYIASYKDLIDAYANTTTDLVQAGKDHFSNFGCKEGRFVTFDPYLYVGSYDDLREACGSDRDSASRHYIEYGFKEGRIPDAFKSLEYIASYKDLIDAYANTTTDLVQAGKDHFSNFGCKEGRFITFDSDLYLKSYDDLRDAFGSDRDSATQHYIKYGFKEGRVLGLSSIHTKIDLSEKSQLKNVLYEDFLGDENYFDISLNPIQNVFNDFISMVDNLIV
ncbi:M10 family metallopeptidase C-terminal domain-containing protein [Candidatus Liberibacter brunswickensis]|uniref:M10 family metallopeptidase C-terminal domain-containing protein n=1 Tax=Candidatus Liberibacter brunswickensis TaxID=1968796 RepID=UPI002FE34E61